MAVIFFLSVPIAGAALGSGCSTRRLDTGGPGTGTVDAGGGGKAGGAGGAAGVGGGASTGGVGGIIPPGDLKKNGAACVAGGECMTGFCADGVCCDADCADGCYRCDLAGAVGTCVTIAAGAPAKTAGACPVEIALTCGNDGTCDGAGACRQRVLGTVCGAGSCNGDAVFGQMVCDGRGNCRAGATIICVPYRCDPTTNACQSTCANDTDCVNGYCESTGRCHVKQGPACQLAGDCASGFCVGGVCCNTACADPCMACNVRNWEGTCTPVPGGCPGADAGGD